MMTYMIYERRKKYNVIPTPCLVAMSQIELSLLLIPLLFHGARDAFVLASDQTHKQTGGIKGKQKKVF
jgi:hypothetical protein